MGFIHERFYATIVDIPPMEDFYIGGASVRLFLPIFKDELPRVHGDRAAGQRCLLQPSAERPTFGKTTSVP
jgi:3-polyprenyl-4-hydroxybenzoate decarboxylase